MSQVTLIVSAAWRLKNTTAAEGSIVRRAKGVFTLICDVHDLGVGIHQEARTEILHLLISQSSTVVVAIALTVVGDSMGGHKDRLTSIVGPLPLVVAVWVGCALDDGVLWDRDLPRHIEHARREFEMPPAPRLLLGMNSKQEARTPSVTADGATTRAVTSFNQANPISSTAGAFAQRASCAPLVGCILAASKLQHGQAALSVSLAFIVSRQRLREATWEQQQERGGHKKHRFAAKEDSLGPSSS